MNEQEIRQLTASRETDALIGVSLFGWKWYKASGLYMCSLHEPRPRQGTPEPIDYAPKASLLRLDWDTWSGGLPYYTTSHGAASEVIDWMIGAVNQLKTVPPFAIIELTYTPTTSEWEAGWTCYDEYGDPVGLLVQADTLPLAICRAALLGYHQCKRNSS